MAKTKKTKLGQGLIKAVKSAVDHDKIEREAQIKDFLKKIKGFKIYKHKD